MLCYTSITIWNVCLLSCTFVRNFAAVPELLYGVEKDLLSRRRDL